MCERFKLNELPPDIFKCLIFVQGLTAPEDGEIKFCLNWNKILKSVGKWSQKNAKENLRHDTTRIEECDLSKISAVKQKQHKEKIACKINPCYGCRQIHYNKECLFRRK